MITAGKYLSWSFFRNTLYFCMKQILFRSCRLEECSYNELVSVVLTMLTWVTITGLILATFIYCIVAVVYFFIG
jgi:hypothetical protein